MRNAFIETLEEEAGKNKNIILLTGDLGFTVFERFMKKFPDRFINMGVAEANMIGVATGLSLTGKIPFVYSIAPFITLRPLEQIRNDVCMHKANVKIVGVGAGLSYSHAGPTHHSNEDIGVLRTLPNITLVSPADPVETKLATREIIKIKGPCYLRLGKKGEQKIYKKIPKFSLGKAIIIKRGTKVALICTGSITYNVIAAAKILHEKNIHPTIISMHTIYPLDQDLLKKIVKTHKIVITVEEHSVVGGLGSAVSEFLAESVQKDFIFKRVGIPKGFCFIVGDHNYLLNYYSLSPEKLAKTVTQVISLYES